MDTDLAAGLGPLVGPDPGGLGLGPFLLDLDAHRHVRALLPLDGAHDDGLAGRERGAGHERGLGPRGGAALPAREPERERREDEQAGRRDAVHQERRQPGVEVVSAHEQPDPGSHGPP